MPLVRHTASRTVVIALALMCMGSWFTFRTYSHSAKTRPDLSRKASRAGSSDPAKPDGATRACVSNAYGKLPLSFEANRGQTGDRVEFVSRGSGYSLFLTSTEAVMALRKPASAKTSDPQSIIRNPKSAVLRMKIIGANPSARVEGQDELAGKSNYFIGNDPGKWRTDVATYAKVRYERVYPGIDLVYHGNRRQLEYDFVVAPGADPARIKLGFDGAQNMRVDPQGGLVLQTAGGAVRWDKPVAYQETDGVRNTIEGQYLLRRGHQVSFEIAAYDSTKPLIIDPTLVYSTYLGGSGDDHGVGITVDSAGSAYVVGYTTSGNFSTTAGAYDTGISGADAFVTKLDPTGSALVYSTYVGGSGFEGAYDVAVDGAGNAYFTGETGSGDFPATAGALETSFNGGGGSDAFVAKLGPTGSSLVYATYLGGTTTSSTSGLPYTDVGYGIAIDAAGNAYVSGYTATSNFPTTGGAYDTSWNGGAYDGYVTKLDATGSTLLYSTYLGGSSDDVGFGHNIAVDASGNAFVSLTTSSTDFPTTAGAFDTTFDGPSDAAVVKLDPSGSTLLYSTFVGGSGDEAGFGLVVDSSGNAYLSGTTSSTDFPATAGAYATTNSGLRDAFIAKLNPAGSGLVYATYLGGSGDDYGGYAPGTSVAIDAAGNAYLTGTTSSTDFPTTSGAQATSLDGSHDAFFAKVSPSGNSLLYSTYLGGSSYEIGQGIATDAAGNAYLTGFTGSGDFPTTAGAFQTTSGGISDAFVAKITPIGAATGTPATLTLSPPAATNPVGTQHCVTATVKDALGNPTPGINVRFSVTGSVTTGGSAITNASGQASFCYTGPSSPGVDAITAYADTNANNTQDAGEPSGAAAKTWAAQTSFVIGDRNAVLGNHVTFWGAQWAYANSLSGGSAPSSFKGFANSATPNPPTCGGRWKSDPGNSSGPPASVPQYIIVLVSSSITKSGSVIYGNVPKMVVVRTDPGYATNPGHAGTGTVVAVICQ